MSEHSNIEIAVAIGRIEEMLKSMNEKQDRHQNVQEQHWSKISEHETQIQLLLERQGPRVHWVTILAGITALAALTVSFLDRMFVAQ